ncbi:MULTISPECIES: hypothetical protein [unclassified Pseudomonas]|uniref:hypothetical protein n=1 Tax=unclassified Pseudomonas TaxID=196821 RepID=UPI000ADEB88F|nr:MULTISPECIES: hypothetical protein [unclassified Pseudomonas]
MTNFVFSRRAIQTCINSLDQTLDISQLAAIVKRLNARDESRLHAMWEVAILSALSNAGALQHEEALANGRCPDISWKIDQPGEGGFTVIGDITTISDDGLEDQNPFKFVSREIVRLASKYGLCPGSFWIDVRGETVGQPHKSKMRLMLPEKSALSNFIKTELEPWIQKIKSNSTKKSVFDHPEDSIGLTIIYDPDWKNGGGSYASYTVATSKSTNPLFSALKGKVKQLNGAPDDAVRIIFACDGGCDLIRRGRTGRSHYTYNSIEVAEDFLRQNSSIDFVLLSTIHEVHHPFGLPTKYSMSYELICAPPKFRSPRVTDECIESLTRALNNALPNIPQPLRPAYNAASLLKTPGVGHDRLGAYSMQGNKVTISSRGLIKLLADEISAEEFKKAHQWEDSGFDQNPFTRHLNNGLMISKIEVTSGNDIDDDEITFTIDKWDAANSPFRTPNTNE